jgi:hypothetical protein
MGRGINCEVLTTADESRWREALARVQEYDYCHLPAFNRLAEQCGHGEARLLVLRDGDSTIAFPVLLRPLPESAGPHLDGASRDVTSVYGYVGPVASVAPIPEDTRQAFLDFVDEFFREHRVVSAFSRLHPLLSQSFLLEGYGEVAPVGWTLSLDLSQSEDQQRACYRRNHRQDIRKLTELGVVCEEAGLERLDDFITMYYCTMDRVGATPEYYFSRSYFDRLMADLPEVAHLFMCLRDGVPIAGGIFTRCRGIVQWYLSGTRADYVGPPPTKLLFDMARQWANRIGAHTLHLGGGVGGSRDSLYHFKAGFSHREHVYSIWRHIVNRKAYEDLCRTACARSGVDPDDSFFPRYRHPLLATCRERAR